MNLDSRSFVVAEDIAFNIQIESNRSSIPLISRQLDNRAIFPLELLEYLNSLTSSKLYFLDELEELETCFGAS